MSNRLERYGCLGIGLIAWLGIGGACVWAQAAATNNSQPTVADSVADPDSDVNSWITRAEQALRAGQPIRT
jgi:hypothetical protein